MTTVNGAHDIVTFFGSPDVIRIERDHYQRSGSVFGNNGLESLCSQNDYLRLTLYGNTDSREPLSDLRRLTPGISIFLVCLPEPCTNTTTECTSLSTGNTIDPDNLSPWLINSTSSIL